MRIVDHRFEGVPYIEALSHGGIIIPKFLVIHYTAGWTAQDAIDIFTNPDRRVSAHIVLDTDGSMTQMLPFNIKAHHAGASYWRGHNGLNSHSIGIEVVNYGDSRMYDKDSGEVLSRRGNRLPNDLGDRDNWVRAEHHLHGGRERFWQKFTGEQYDVLDTIVPQLIHEYNLREVVGHDEIATPAGRKPDPGPAFPIEFYKQFADYANSESEGRYVVVGVGDDKLNCRGGPGSRYSILRTFNKGDSFKVLKFEGNWALIEFDNKRGWVHSAYIIRA